ncbi:MAG: RluA family pseudouridine synthase [Gemmatimonadaceae bacterium]
MRAPRPTGAPNDAVTLEADSDVRLDLFVAGRLDVSRTRAATLIATGQVLVDERLEKASYKPRSGERVEIWRPAPAPEPRIEPEQIALDVVHEDADLLVLDKPAGMVVHPAPGNWSGTIVNALLGRGLSADVGGTASSTEPRAGLVHRLDKETSGLLLVAKTERSHRILATALAQRRVVRRYALLSHGHLRGDSLVVEQPVARDPRDRKRMAIVQSGKPAKTTFVRLARFDAGDLLRATLHTGRTHQIRVHLASVGHPVMGDQVYGGSAGPDRRLARLPAGRHFLHAAWLRFRHPSSGALIDIRSPLPADLKASLAHVSGNMHWLDTEEGDPLDEYGFYRDDT